MVPLCLQPLFVVVITYLDVRNWSVQYLSVNCSTLLERWSDEYLTFLRQHNKWKHPSRNIQVGDIVILQEDNLIPTKWPLAKVVHVHPGNDGFVRVATVKTSTGIYKRTITKMALHANSQ